MRFSQAEYDQHLVDPQWSLKETHYLFEILARYDLRFIVVADRYEYRDGARVKQRTIEVRFLLCARLIE